MNAISTFRHGALALAATLLAACAVGPDYRRPESALPDKFRAGSQAGSQADAQTDSQTDSQTAGASSSDIQGNWWTLYRDPLLDQLVERALRENANLKVTLARVEQAQAVLRVTNAAFFPEIAASGSGARIRIGAGGGSSGSSGGAIIGSGSARIVEIYQLGLSTSSEIDLWGKLRRATESARADLLATSYARDFAVISLASTTVQAYFALRALDAQIAVTQQTRSAVDESLVLAKKRLDAGYASGLDLAQAQSQAATIAVQLREYRRLREVQEHQIGVLTADPGRTIAPGNLDTLPLPASPPPGLPSTLLQRRPDVRQAEQELVSANAQIGVARADLFPTFTLTGVYGGQSLQFADLLKAPFRFWSLGLGVRLPIFAAGKYTARVDLAEARARASVAVYQGAVEGAFRDVADALVNGEETAAGEIEVQAQVDAARRALKLSQARYRQGYSAYLDVLDAQRTANAAELALVQKRQARLNYSVDLVKALGGGWQGDAR